MPRRNRVPEMVEVVYVSSDSDSSDDENNYPREWIRRTDPRFAGKITRAGRLPFGPGFNKDITVSQAGGDQFLVSFCFLHTLHFPLSFLNI